MIQEIHTKLINDLKERNIKAWQIKKGVIDNPYPISQNYIWFLSKPQFMERVKLASLYRMKMFFDSKSNTDAN